MLGSSEEIEVLKALFAASSAVDVVTDGKSPWQVFLQRLAKLTRADAATLTLGEGDTTQHWMVGNSASKAPTPPRNNRVYSHSDFSGLQNNPMRALRVAVDAHSSAILTIWRDQDDFRAVATSQLSALGPYLGQALATWSMLSTEREIAQVTRKLAKKRGLGWVAFDASGRALKQDRNARDILRDLGTIRIGATGTLDFKDSDTAQNFRAALRTIQTDAPTKPVTLCDHPRIELVLTKFENSISIIGCLQQTPKAIALPAKSLSTYLDLSPSEARLAALLCDGDSIKSAAEQLGWTIETAKSCSKQIYARSGVNGQTGLLRKVLNGAIWLT